MSNGTPHSGRLWPSLNPLKRARTPNFHDDASVAGESTADKELNPVIERRQRLMRDLYARSERMIDALYDRSIQTIPRKDPTVILSSSLEAQKGLAQDPSLTQPKRRAAREIQEDDYGDDEEDDEEDEDARPFQSAVSTTQRSHGLQPDVSEPATQMMSSKATADCESGSGHKDPPKSPEEARKRLEEEKRATEVAAKANFLQRIYTLENDRDAMLEQQKLDELDRQVETETSGSHDNQEISTQAHGTLSSANLGASSLALKHLIAQIDRERHRVPASDTEIQHLVSAVRKNRSKWASEERVGQEELYEAAERVLMDLKAQTEYSTPFLQRVKQREAPDYLKIISRPMDIGSMLKRLKNLEYKSKREFTNDLNQIWTNCLEYNKKADHPLRKKAEHMKKETARLAPLIPDIVIRDRAEIEAEEREERRRHFATLDDSDDDDQPIVATRGRKAPSKKGAKGTSTTRKAPPTADQATQESPAPDTKPPTQISNSAQVNSGIKLDHLRSDIDSMMEGSQNGFSTPPVGNHTPLGAGSALDGTTAASHADPSEIDGINSSVNGIHGPDQLDDAAEEDEEHKIWKQVTKKDRARIAAERHRLFKLDRLNPDEPALLRTRIGMRRWMRQQRTLLSDEASSSSITTQELKDRSDSTSSQTLAEGIDGDDDCTLPDYYYPLAGVPAISERIKWTEDADGFVIDRREDCLRVVPRGHFTAPKSLLGAKMDSNMRQMQETRKIMSKIGMVKQMQLQTQTYQNQFQKYEPEPFQEADVEPMIVSDEGPVMQSALNRAALQRTIAKVFYHAGFEEYQPSALDAATDIVTDYIHRLTTTLVSYHEHQKVNPAVPESCIDPTATTTAKPVDSPVPIVNEWQPRFTPGEAVLHTLQRNGHDLESLTSYIEDDVPRLGQKLAAHHEAARQYYTDLLRPVMDPTTVTKDGGASAFDDGNETQFVAGDFAEDIDEDFFGFKELGLDKEFGIGNFSVPLHLLQSRFNNTQQAVAGAGTGANTETLFEEPPRWSPVTEESIQGEIGLVQDFFREKLGKANGATLVEDEDLPAKQRFPKPRLPPTGKISSPRKRPIREQQMMARKKRRLEIEAERERERQGQEGHSSANMDVRGASAVNTQGADIQENLDASGRATVEDGTGANSEESSRRPSVTQTANSAIANGVLTNGDIEQSTPTKTDSTTKPWPKPVDKLRLEKPKEDQPVDTDPEKQNKPAETSETLTHGDQDKESDGGLLSPETLPIAAH